VGPRVTRAIDNNRGEHEGTVMQEKTYKLIELVGVSSESIEDAIQSAISRANQTLRNLDWFEVTETRGLIQEGKINQFQVKLKVGFRLMS
jgi:flavin-binding protein dodecin